jgi:hypothetical protein
MKFIATGGAAPDVRREASDSAVARERNKLRPVGSSWEHVTFSIKKKSDQRPGARFLQTSATGLPSSRGYQLSQGREQILPMNCAVTKLGGTVVPDLILPTVAFIWSGAKSCAHHQVWYCPGNDAMERHSGQ